MIRPIETPTCYDYCPWPRKWLRKKIDLIVFFFQFKAFDFFQPFQVILPGLPGPAITFSGDAPACRAWFRIDGIGENYCNSEKNVVVVKTFFFFWRTYFPLPSLERAWKLRQMLTSTDSRWEAGCSLGKCCLAQGPWRSSSWCSRTFLRPPLPWPPRARWSRESCSGSVHLCVIGIIQSVLYNRSWRLQQLMRKNYFTREIDIVKKKRCTLDGILLFLWKDNLEITLRMPYERPCKTFRTVLAHLASLAEDPCWRSPKPLPHCEKGGSDRIPPLLSHWRRFFSRLPSMLLRSFRSAWSRRSGWRAAWAWSRLGNSSRRGFWNL